MKINRLIIVGPVLAATLLAPIAYITISSENTAVNGKSGDPFKNGAFVQNPESEFINIDKIFSGYDPRVIEEIVPYFQLAANQGDSAANLLLGLASAKIFQDYEKAADYLHKFQNIFDPSIEIIESSSCSGVCDAIEINRYHETSKALGFSTSYYRIPISLHRSFSFRGNKKMFLQHLGDYNSASANCLLGMIYQHESAVFDADLPRKPSLEQSKKFASYSSLNYSKEAQKYFDRSAAQRFVPAMILLAHSLQNGIGMDKDSVKAELWLKCAANSKSR
jgi:TPR repeat protein